MNILKKRSDFLKAAKGLKYVSRGFVLQAIQPHNKDVQTINFGFTASKKVGNAVCRNRAKRRLRVLARNIAQPLAQTNHNYIFIARKNILDMDFAKLEADVAQAMHKIHRSKPVKSH